MSTTVSSFFLAAATSPQSQLNINHRERCDKLGDALIQSAIEYHLRLRLAKGEIKLIKPNELINNIEQITKSTPQYQSVNNGVRCLVLSPLSPRIIIDLVKSALIREKVRFFSIRKLYGGALEITTEDTHNVDRLIKNGLVLYNNWFTRVRDVTTKRCHRRYHRSVCFLCNNIGHIEVMCVKQVPDRPTAFGG